LKFKINPQNYFHLGFIPAVFMEPIIIVEEGLLTEEGEGDLYFA